MKNPDQLTLGIDEAGRGPIIGPMVIAAVALRPRKAAALTRLGVTDSKRFLGDRAHQERSELIPHIFERADWIGLRVIDVSEVDRRCREKGLNRLEQDEARRLIEAAPPCRRIVCDGRTLFRPLSETYSHLEACDRAELEHASVAAASILAKVRRDELWKKISARYAHEFGEEMSGRGGGYANQATRTFLRAYIERHRRLPPEARRSWPWGFARDLLGSNFDPFWDVPDDRAQLPLFSAKPPEDALTA